MLDWPLDLFAALRWMSPEVRPGLDGSRSPARISMGESSEPIVSPGNHSSLLMTSDMKERHAQS